ncbi:hypothetical protein [Geobacter sp. FeAm09]|uniref:hypothetical protein n=1 Tax=Geobacter sp. FeAm09 TaxID=2597769 RepID=UPI00197A9326|nr:hypothetical protein [Geobacter sp. FeAm09]
MFTAFGNGAWVLMVIGALIYGLKKLLGQPCILPKCNNLDIEPMISMEESIKDEIIADDYTMNTINTRTKSLYGGLYYDQH